MENYILSLIKENNRVIVPNFGAFIVAKENGISVLFNNFLSFNDGLLVDYIVTKENISKEDATQKVDDYVKKVKDKLGADGKYTIQGLGTFTKDATGILRFVQVDNIGVDEKAKEDKKTSVTPISDDLLDIDNDTKDTLDEKDVPDTKLSSTKLNDTTPIAEVVEEKPEAKPQEPKKKEPVKAKTTKPTEKKEEKKPTTVNNYINEDNDKRNRSIILFLIIFILIPIIGFGIYVLFFKGDSPAETQKQIQTEINKVEPQDTPANDNIGEIEAGPDTTAAKPVEEVVEKVKVEKDVNKPHQLIVGSFSSEVNAEKMVQKLKAKGYDKAFAFNHNNRVLVSLEPFAKVYEAQAKQEEILASDRMESWVMTKRN